MRVRVAAMYAALKTHTGVSYYIRMGLLLSEAMYDLLGSQLNGILGNASRHCVLDLDGLLQ